ncbi:hypothetical protein FGO68_gene567 [Halteria grandinella]|uniref:Alpha-galactosidase n=1 Tax=Halteria grandinella TaxID=5974 RepID=A0A8J8NQ71_HALGN|nr:hypothetical protein FGO68_gene567 [Halteria grandinella]
MHFIILLPLLFVLSSALNNNLGLTPPMGWNTWNRYGCDINETVVMTNAEMLGILGLDKLGYRYVNVDDCWNLATRDSMSNRTIVDPERFPSGMKALSDFVHDRGLKFGIYSSAGTLTCEGRAGSLGYEDLDAQDYVSWGVDYLKYDNCFNEGIPSFERYQTMKKALEKAAHNHTIFYSICNWGLEEVWQWGNETGNSWRTAGDIFNSWESVKYNFEVNQLHPDVAGPGGWNDPDMLEVGNGGLSHTEERTHFALWAVVKAPLILGCNLNTISNRSLSIISNKELIKLNQDSKGDQAVCVHNCHSLKDSEDVQVFGGWNKDNGGYYGLVAVNWNDLESKPISIDFKSLGLTKSSEEYCSVYDLWNKGVHIGNYQGKYLIPNIDPHDNVALKIKCKRKASSLE